MNRTNCIGLSLVCCLTVLPIVVVHSTAWGGCTVQERIDLGGNGYNKEEVGKLCGDAGGENFLETLTKSFITNLATGASDSLTKSLNKALVGRDREATSAPPSTTSASLCVTDVGTCPLFGGPSGAGCYCQAWNGATFMGISR